MSNNQTYLKVSDSVLVRAGGKQTIGTIECVTSLDGTIYFGINLIAPVANGGDGCFNGIQHFNTPPGHGLFTRKMNIIRKITGAELMIITRDMLQTYKKRLDQYVDALAERDEFIEKLKKQFLTAKSAKNGL